MVQGLVAAALDEQLLSAAKGGDSDAFGRLISPFLLPAHRLAASMLNDAALAEDVVQESTLRAWRGVSSLRSASRVRPWFFRIVANRARTLRGRRWWSEVALPLFDRHPNRDGDIDEHTDLVSALQTLGSDERAAILMRFYEDMNSSEIGEVLGISAATVRSRIFRALRRLRVELTEDVL